MLHVVITKSMIALPGAPPAAKGAGGISVGVASLTETDPRGNVVRRGSVAMVIHDGDGGQCVVKVAPEDAVQLLLQLAASAALSDNALPPCLTEDAMKAMAEKVGAWMPRIVPA